MHPVAMHLGQAAASLADEVDQGSESEEEGVGEHGAVVMVHRCVRSGAACG